MPVLRRVCVFTGSSLGARGVYASAAHDLAAVLVAHGIGLVYGGGSIGLMGTVADGVLAGGGEVIGVIPHALATKEIAHHGLTELRVVPSMHERKALMTELADGFVALPGGFGTFDELFEAITWGQLGVHAKPIGVLDVDAYFAPFFTLVEHAIAERFVRPAYRDLVLREDDPAVLLERMTRHRPPESVVQWLGRDET